MAQRRGLGGQMRRLDQGGAQRRLREAERRSNEEHSARMAAQERVRQAAGRIPVLKSMDEVVKYAGATRDSFAGRSKISFPALQLSKELDMFEVFAALPQNYGVTPNIVAERIGEESVGPHFDNYFDGYRPWTIHENMRGNGIVRAAFLPAAQLEGYRRLAESLPDIDEADELLAINRGAMGKIALEAASAHQLYTGEVEEGTRTLIWNGDTHMPPAVHEISRSEPGDYRIYAHQSPGTELGAGFTYIEQD